MPADWRKAQWDVTHDVGVFFGFKLSERGGAIVIEHLLGGIADRFFDVTYEMFTLVLGFMANAPGEFHTGHNLYLRDTWFMYMDGKICCFRAKFTITGGFREATSTD